MCLGGGGLCCKLFHKHILSFVRCFIYNYVKDVNLLENFKKYKSAIELMCTATFVLGKGLGTSMC